MLCITLRKTEVKQLWNTSSDYNRTYLSDNTNKVITFKPAYKIRMRYGVTQQRSIPLYKKTNRIILPKQGVIILVLKNIYAMDNTPQNRSEATMKHF